MENQRHHLIILGNFQRRIIISSVLGAVLLTNLMLIAWFLLEPQLLGRFDTSDTIVIAVLELAIMTAVFYISLLASNKIAGPLYSFDKVLQQIRGGDLTARLHLRHGDLFMDVATEMNQTFDDISARVNQLKATTAQLQEADNSEEKKALLDELTTQLNSMKSR